MLKRHSRLKPFFDKHSLDAILFTELKNIRYLCGFSGSEGALLVAADRAWFFCDSRYTAQAAAEIIAAEVLECGDARVEQISQIAVSHGLRSIGFEAAHTTVISYRKLAEKLAGIELVEIDSSLDQIRGSKDQSEISKMAAVADLASQSLEAILPNVKPGVREAEIALSLEIEMRRRGADGRAFDFIVASGERGAMPHGRASDKLIASGELVTIDFGALLDGYHSDETVTVACGSPSTKAVEIHSAVLAAHDLAIDAVRPGMSCRDLDIIARSYIDKKGYAAYFGHGLGHGVGLDIHEFPTVSPRSSAVLEEGMVITIEPGIYIPGFGGVRIEDTVVVTADACSLLTKANKRLIIL